MAQQYTATDYHGFKDPDFGAKDYAEQWSDNLTWFDERIVRRGLKADRPAAGTQGRVWITTDSGSQTVYLDTGSAWVAIAGSDMGGGTVERDEIQVSDGSATDPSFTFKNDTDTGIYRSGSGDVAITSNGNKSLEVRNGDVIQTGAGYLKVHGYNGGGDGHIFSASDSSAYLTFYDAFNSQIILKASVGGNVYIPNGPLDVDQALSVGAADNGSSVKIARYGTGGTGWGQDVSVIRTSTGSNGVALVPHGDPDGDGTTDWFDGIRAEASGRVTIPNGGATISGVTGRQALTITNPGSSTSVHLGKPSGSHAAITDDANTEVAQFHDGGNIDFPAGHVGVDQNSALKLKGAGDGSHYVAWGQGTFATSGRDLTEISGWQGVELWEATNGQPVLQAQAGGNVAVPNGELHVDADIEITGGKLHLKDATPADLFKAENTGTAGSQFTTRIDDADYRFWMYNSAAGGGSTALQIHYDTKNIEIPNGDLLISNSSTPWTVHQQGDDDLAFIYDDGGTSEAAGPVLHTSGAVTYFSKATFEGYLAAQQGLTILSGSTGTNRYGLLYESGTDDILLTNREAGGATYIASNTGSAGGDAKAIHIPSASSPKVEVLNGLEANGGEKIDRQARATIPTSEIPDGDHAEIPVHIPAGLSIQVWMWGCRDDTQSTPAGLTVELYDETGAVSVASASTAHAKGSPIASLTGGTASVDATLRLNNDTGGPINAGAVFGYTVN